MIIKHITHSIKHRVCNKIHDISFHVSYSEPSNNSGQAAIVLVMVVSIITIVFMHVAILNISSLVRATDVVKGDYLRTKTEGYLENGAIRYIRDPSYTGESLNEGDVSCTIVISDIGGSDDIVANCTEAGRSKTLGLTVTYSGGVFQFSKITER